MNLEIALATLERHGVEFIVVGGVAVAAHGSSLMTNDLDILYRLEPSNVERLVAAFAELDAVAHDDPRRLPFGFDHLNNTGHHLADTRAGRIDALGAIGVRGDVRYEDLHPSAVEFEAFGVRFRCIGLGRLIEIKRELGRPRDLLAVMELEAIVKLQRES